VDTKFSVKYVAYFFRVVRFIDHVEPRTPSNLPLDTPDSVQTSPESSRAERRDPSYEPPRTPRSRIELHTTRVQPPLTRARARDRTQDDPAEA